MVGAALGFLTIFEWCLIALAIKIARDWSKIQPEGGSRDFGEIIGGSASGAISDAIANVNEPPRASDPARWQAWEVDFYVAANAGDMDKLCRAGEFFQENCRECSSFSSNFGENLWSGGVLSLAQLSKKLRKKSPNGSVLLKRIHAELTKFKALSDIACCCKEKTLHYEKAINCIAYDGNCAFDKRALLQLLKTTKDCGASVLQQHVLQEISANWVKFEIEELFEVVMEYGDKDLQEKAVSHLCDGIVSGENQDRLLNVFAQKFPGKLHWPNVAVCIATANISPGLRKDVFNCNSAYPKWCRYGQRNSMLRYGKGRPLVECGEE
jgi:hypothetical protein